MRFLRSLNLENLSEFLHGISLKVLMTLLSASFVVASGATFMGALFLKPQLELGQTEQKPQKVVELTVQPRHLSPKDIEVIEKRNIFNSEGTLGDQEALDPEEVKPEVNVGEIVKSSLPLKLMGVIFAGAPDAGLAMIKNVRKQRVLSYLSGDTVMKNVRVVDIYERRVVLDNNGRKEYIEMDEVEIVRSRRGRKSKPTSSGAGKLAPIAKGPVSESFKEEGFERQGHDVTLTSQYKENLLGPQMAKVLQDAKAEPNMVNGELRGFKLTRIREASIYQKAGFQSGDVVQEINGIPLTDAAGAIRLLQSLRNANEIEVRVQRGGDTFNLNVNIQ